MAAHWIESVTGALDQKKAYRRHMARVKGFPEPYRSATLALERYFMYYGGITDGQTLMGMVDDHADLWERAALDQTPIRAIVGDDPVEFAEAFVRSYSGTQWIDKERSRLNEAIDTAAADGNAGTEPGK